MSRVLPTTIRKYVGQKLSPNFRDAVKLVQIKLQEPRSGEVLIKNRFVGINASDINFTAGRYDPSLKPPFDCGFEGVGEVVATGPECKRLSVGQPVGYSQHGAFAEYTVVAERRAFPLPDIRPEYLSFPVSGLTAAISLDKVGEIRKGERVLVTAAAGGTGQFAVQWAKQAGCEVIGTCSSDEKVQFLKKIGCDRPINYNKEDLKSVLKEEYPRGVDVVYESIGGDMFDTCLNSLATRGRLTVIGFISGYENSVGIAPIKTPTPALTAKLLTKSASVRGFFMEHFRKFYPEYMAKLVNLVSEGKMMSEVDFGRFSDKGPFRGLDSVPDAVQYMYDRKNVGKVVVDVGGEESKL